MSKKLLSVVLPAYNEENNIPLIYDELMSHIDTTRFITEIIFVNDGSTDQTWRVIKDLFAENKNIRGINFSRNFGHHAALEAGLKAARGDIIIMMDADLQHPPKLIKTLIGKYDEGYEIVNTVRLGTKNVSIFKRLSSAIFYKVLNNISDMKMTEGEADYRLLSRRVLSILNDMPETPKFYRGLVNWVGYDVARVGYLAESRIHGRSSYTLKKMIELARLGITSFSMKPLKIIMTIGIVTVGVASVLLLALLSIKFLINTELVSYNAILTTVLMLVAGILTTFQGIIAIYLVDIFNATKGRPTFITRDELGTK